MNLTFFAIAPLAFAADPNASSAGLDPGDTAASPADEVAVPPPDPEDDAVTGGRPAAEGAWPDAAAVYFGSEVGCTGVLIAPDVVLTAGHCAAGITAVKLDTTDFRRGGERIAAREVVAYPKWARSYDVALVFLEEASSVEPRVIARGCVLEESLEVGAPVSVVGWGATDAWGEEYGTTLQEGVTEVEDPDCTDLASGCNRTVSPAGEIGAGGGGVDACFGDSGGPLYLLTDDGTYLVGITSRGYDDARLPCSQGGIYTRPDAVIDWIEEEIGHALPRPSCDGSAGAAGDGPDDPALASEITSMSYEVGVCGLPLPAGMVAVGLGGPLGVARRGPGARGSGPDPRRSLAERTARE